jgi:hypothetical protein
VCRQDVPLLALDLGAGVVARGIDRRPEAMIYSGSAQGVECVWNRSDNCVRGSARDLAVTLNLDGVGRDLDLLEVLLKDRARFQSEGRVDRLALSTNRSKLSSFGAPL